MAEQPPGRVRRKLRATPHSAASAARALYSAGYHIGRVAHGQLSAGSASGDPELARLFETAAVSVFTGCQLVLPDVAQLAIAAAAAEMAAQAAQDAQEEPEAAQGAQEPGAAQGEDTSPGGERWRASEPPGTVLVELDGQLAAVGALPPARWLVSCFEIRQTGSAWEYRPVGDRTTPCRSRARKRCTSRWPTITASSRPPPERHRAASRRSRPGANGPIWLDPPHPNPNNRAQPPVSAPE